MYFFIKNKNPQILEKYEGFKGFFKFLMIYFAINGVANKIKLSKKSKALIPRMMLIFNFGLMIKFPF